MPDLSTTADRNAALTRLLAARALEMAVDASAYRPARGERRVSMLIARPAARRLAGAEDAQAQDAAAQAWLRMVEAARASAGGGAGGLMPHVVDGAGHRRGVYYPLMLHLLFSAWAMGGDSAGSPDDTVREATQVLLAPLTCDMDQDAETSWDDPAAAPRLALALWRALVALEGALLTNDHLMGIAALGVLGQAAAAPSPNGALHPQSRDDTPDAWVYRELTGLHALHLASQVARDASWAARCGQVAQYHLGHTQPDYTTYQPWALAAFAEGEGTAVFAEQQLHDVQTHLAVEGPGGALLPGLLLADAAASLDGRIVSLWQRFRFQG